MVTVFGQPSTPKIISLSLDGNQFEIYNKISRNYSNSFLFESLTGPEELAETSIMGFDPELIVKGYYDRVTIETRDGTVKTIETSDPLNKIKELVLKHLIRHIDTLVVQLAISIMMQSGYGRKFQKVNQSMNR